MLALGPGGVKDALSPQCSCNEVDRLNAAGGVGGRKIQLVTYDDGGDANKAKTFAQRLVEEDKVVAMVGGSTTGTTMAMIPVFEDAEVPFVSLAGAILAVVIPALSLTQAVGKGDVRVIVAVLGVLLGSVAVALFRPGSAIHRYLNR